jgi:hypothetical protein
MANESDGRGVPWFSSRELTDATDGINVDVLAAIGPANQVIRIPSARAGRLPRCAGGRLAIRADGGTGLGDLRHGEHNKLYSRASTPPH